jgi:hypothetical protein
MTPRPAATAGLGQRRRQLRVELGDAIAWRDIVGAA